MMFLGFLIKCSNTDYRVLFLFHTAVFLSWVFVIAPITSFASEITGGHLGDSLSTALEARANNTGEKFIITQEALIAERRVGTESLLNAQSNSFLVGGWTIIHMPEENTVEMQRRYNQNLSVWRAYMKDKITYSGLPSPIKLPGVHIKAVNKIYSHACGLNIDIGFTLSRYIVIYDINGTPVNEACRDYMLILAANNIVVERKNGVLVANLVGDK